MKPVTVVQDGVVRLTPEGKKWVETLLCFSYEIEHNPKISNYVINNILPELNKVSRDGSEASELINLIMLHYTNP